MSASIIFHFTIDLSSWLWKEDLVIILTTLGTMYLRIASFQCFFLVILSSVAHLWTLRLSEMLLMISIAQILDEEYWQSGIAWIIILKIIKASSQKIDSLLTSLASSSATTSNGMSESFLGFLIFQISSLITFW